MKKIPAFVALLFTCISLKIVAAPLFINAQDDTVMAKEAMIPPTIDGLSNDDCWASAVWQNIDQVWITWGEEMDAADFTGRYKVTWSSETDRLYFLVEITDDVLVKGYTFPDGGWPDWDVTEIFFDEDASGGDHTHNNNAFAYHITAGNDQKSYEVIDLQDGWDPVNFTDHIECAIINNGNNYLWEISMIVYNDSYDPAKSTNPTEQLEIGKVSGLSIAYCDNDDPNENPKTRDNFIGSVEVPQSRYNHHWQDASDFGTVKLVAADFASSVANAPVLSDFILLQNYPNPFNPGTSISFRLPQDAHVRLKIYNTLGQHVNTLVDGVFGAGSHVVQWDGLDSNGQSVGTGVYLYQLEAEMPAGLIQQTQKMIRTQ